MDIRVSGHQVATGEALQTHASERLTLTVEKYFHRALSSHVTFNRAPAGAFRCDIVTHVMQGLILKGAGIAQDEARHPRHQHHRRDDDRAAIEFRHTNRRCRVFQRLRVFGDRGLHCDERALQFVGMTDTHRHV